MVTPAAGSVVLVPFPFSDLSQAKRRPGLVLASAGRDDWILCQITGKSYGDPQALKLTDAHFKTGSLRLVSYVRPGKLFTANQSLLVGQVGTLKPARFRQIIEAVISLLRSGLPDSGEGV